RFLARSGDVVGKLQLWSGDLFPNLSGGFIGYAGDSGHQVVSVAAYAGTGVTIGSTEIVGGGFETPDPDGGLLLVGSFRTSFDAPPPPGRVAFKVDRTGR